MADETNFQSAMELLKPAPAEPARFPLHWLSDLALDQARRMNTVWPALTENARRDLMARMEEEARKNFEMDFSEAARIGLRDRDAEVRIHAIRILSDCEDRRGADRLLDILRGDPDFLVRAEAASALGRYMEWAELGEIGTAVGEKVADALRVVLADAGEHLEVRRKAVESIGYSSEESIKSRILEAYRHAEESMRISAITAMGHSLDSAWEPQVKQALESGLPVMRAEAARAAGEIAIPGALSALIELLSDSEPDVRRNAIWALGEIGGSKARRALENLEQRADASESEWVAEALENLDFEESLSGEMPLFDADEVEEDTSRLDEEEESE